MSSDLPANILKTLETIGGTKTKMRSAQEITARYKLALQNYKNLCMMSGDIREQKAGTYAEIKILGWVLGKTDKDVIRDISAHSLNTSFPNQSES